MNKARAVIGILVLGVSAAFFCSLFLPCQKVNIRGGWSVGLEAAPIFTVTRVYESFPTHSVLRVSFALVLLVFAGMPVGNILLSSAGKLAGTFYLTYHALSFRFWGAFLLGRADQVLYGYHVHVWMSFAAAVLCILILLAELYLRVQTKRAIESNQAVQRIADRAR